MEVHEVLNNNLFKIEYMKQNCDRMDMEGLIEELRASRDMLQENYDSLHQNYDSLHHENDKMARRIAELEAMLAAKDR